MSKINLIASAYNFDQQLNGNGEWEDITSMYSTIPFISDVENTSRRSFITISVLDREKNPKQQVKKVTLTLTAAREMNAASLIIGEKRYINIKLATSKIFVDSCHNSSGIRSSSTTGSPSPDLTKLAHPVPPLL